MRGFPHIPHIPLMTPDKDTLQLQLNALLADAQMLAENVKARHDAIEKLKDEITQYRGAHSYNARFTEAVQKQLADLAAAASQPVATA